MLFQIDGTDGILGFRLEMVIWFDVKNLFRKVKSLPTEGIDLSTAQPTGSSEQYDFQSLGIGVGQFGQRGAHYGLQIETAMVAHRLSRLEWNAGKGRHKTRRQIDKLNALGTE